MLLYILTIIICSLLIIAGNVFFVPFDLNNLFSVSLDTVVGVISIMVFDAIGALIVRRTLPMSWFAPERRIFKVSKKEKNFYVKLGVKAWKDKVPELGGLTGFRKNQFSSSSDIEYLKRFITETNYGVVVHLVNAIPAFVICFIPLCSAPSIWIPIYIVNFVLNLLPVFILRYVNHTLLRLYEKKQKSLQKTVA